MGPDPRMALKPFAFVLMPFDSKFADIYHLGIKKAAENAGLVAERVDEQHFTETMLDRIYRQIDAADLIIADMSGMNPNVFYEVGYAHAKDKLCALVTSSASDIPFDLKHHHHVIYEDSISKLVDRLTPKLVYLREQVELAKQSSVEISARAFSGNLARTDYNDVGTCKLQFTLRNPTANRSGELEAFYMTVGPGWRVTSDGERCVFEERVNSLGQKVQRHLVRPKSRRLSPNAFDVIVVECERTFWSKFAGDEKKESYDVKGQLEFEVHTSEGTIKKVFPLDVQFDELPF